jgi:hypothetical protein
MWAWLSTNVPVVLSVVGVLISAAVAVLHALHKDDVAAKLQEFEDILTKLQAPKA